MRPVALALVLLGGCAFSTECKMMGCVSGISVSGASADAQVCLESVCIALNGSGPPPGPFARFDDVHEGDAKHVLTVDGTRYEGPIRFEKLQPNGPKCGPRCYQAAFVLANGKLELQKN
jgi:hypothetical protein